MAKSAAERTRECRARKKASQTIQQWWAGKKKHNLVMKERRKVEKLKALATGTKTAGALRQAAYRDNLPAQKKYISMEKAKANAKKWRLRQGFLKMIRLRAQAAERMRKYRQSLSAEQRAEQLSKSIIRSHYQRIEYRKYKSVSQYMFSRYGYRIGVPSAENRRARTRRYWAMYTDTTALERSRKRRRCIYPPCKEITLIDGMCHLGKYCPYLYYGARQRHMEENNRKGISTAIYDSNPELVYFDIWNRAYATMAPTKDFVSPIYTEERTGDKYIVDVNKRCKLCLYSYDPPDSDEDIDNSCVNSSDNVV